VPHGRRRRHRRSDGAAAVAALAPRPRRGEGAHAPVPGQPVGRVRCRGRGRRDRRGLRPRRGVPGVPRAGRDHRQSHGLGPAASSGFHGSGPARRCLRRGLQGGAHQARAGMPRRRRELSLVSLIRESIPCSSRSLF
jgi:hypothetical protein